MPKLTREFLEALDQLSRARHGQLPSSDFQEPTLRNMLDHGWATTRGMWPVDRRLRREDERGRSIARPVVHKIAITESGKRLVEAYRLGKSVGRRPPICA